MMSLLRKHFEMLQSSHSHGDNKDTTSDGGHKFLQIAKAKRTLTSSFENLMSKVDHVTI